MERVKIVLGADPLGFDLKETVREHLEKQGYEVCDITREKALPYFEVGKRIGQAISGGRAAYGFLFCGTGMGVHLVANKYPGVYCAVCESVLTAKLCRVINDCNAMAMGGQILGPYTAVRMVDAFLQAHFSEGFSPASPAFLQDAVKQVKTIEDGIWHQWLLNED